MEIRYLGHSSFLLKGREVKIVCDPFKDKDPQLGLRFPKDIEADIVTISHSHYDHSGVESVSGNPYIIKEPGEFEIKGISIFGTESFHDDQNGASRGKNTIFSFEIDDLNICHLGDLGDILTPEQTKEIGEEVDVLMIPIGGQYTLDAQKAIEVISQIEPKIVIPMHYKVDGLNLEIDGLENFMKEIGKEDFETQDKLVIKSSDSLSEETQIIVLNRK